MKTLKKMQSPQPDDPRLRYELALQTAVSWLGDRHLLAQPVTRRADPPPFFAAPRRWHDTPAPRGAISRKH